MYPRFAPCRPNTLCEMRMCPMFFGLFDAGVLICMLNFYDGSIHIYTHRLKRTQFECGATSSVRLIHIWISSRFAKLPLWASGGMGTSKKKRRASRLIVIYWPGPERLHGDLAVPVIINQGVVCSTSHTAHGVRMEEALCGCTVTRRKRLERRNEYPLGMFGIQIKSGSSGLVQCKSMTIFYNISACSALDNVF